MCDFSTKEVFHRQSGEDFSNGKNSGNLLPRATQQVFPLRQLAIPLSQQELRLQRDLSQSLQAQWWGPELPQE